MRWESLVGRVVVILVVGALFGWVGSALWNPNRSGGPGAQPPFAPPHLAIVLVLGGVWLVFAFFVIRNRDR